MNKTAKQNNETFGITVEKTLCQLFNDTEGENRISDDRIDSQILSTIKPQLALFIKNQNIPNLKYCGERQNKSDFINPLNQKTYSIKTNKNNDKVCPQIIGQPTKKTFKEKLYNK